MKINYLFICLFFCTNIFSQNKLVQGTVYYDNEPISSANVIIQSGNYYYNTVSNDEGNFSSYIDDAIDKYTITAEDLNFVSVSKNLNYVENQSVKMIFIKESSEVIDELIIDILPKKTQRFADKIVINVEDVTLLNSGSVFEAINKLPGVLVTGNGQIAHNGKLATIFLDGEPTGMSGDQLTNFLKNLPANSVKDIEIIDNPGAKYSATFNGTIINVITKSAKIVGLSGSVMQENKINNKLKSTTSAQLMFKKNKFSWNVNTGYTHHEGNVNSINDFSYISNGNSIEANENYWTNNWYQSYFLRNNFQYKINDRANLSLKYNFNHTYSKPKTYGSMRNVFNNQETIYNQLTESVAKGNQHETQFIYTQKLDTIGTNFSLTSNTQWQTSASENKLFVRDNMVSKILSNNNFIYSHSKADFETPIKLINGNLGLGTHYTHSVSNNNGAYFWNSSREFIPYDFKYTNKAAYATISSNIKSLMISAGLRCEDLTYQTETVIDSLNKKASYNNLFPSITLRYPLISGVYLTAGYNKRMNLPGAQAFNPNITTQNSLLVANAGNPNLKPEISHNGNISLTVFDYIYFSYNRSVMPNQNVVFYDVTDSGTLESKYHTIENGISQSFNMGLPIPYAIFSKGIKNLVEDRNSINPDELSFTYFNAGYFKTNYDAVIPEKFQRGAFYIFTYSQWYLGNNARFFITYYNMFKGVMNLYELNKPSQNLSLTFNKKFLDNKLSLNLGVENVLNNDGYNVNVFGNGLKMQSITNNERRMFKIGLTYNFGGFKDQNQQMFPQQTVPFK